MCPPYAAGYWIGQPVEQNQEPHFWSNEYEAVKLPDALSGVRQALQAAFGRDVRAVAPTEAKYNIFNGVYIPNQPNAVYVNVASESAPTPCRWLSLIVRVTLPATMASVTMLPGNTALSAE